MKQSQGGRDFEKGRMRFPLADEIANGGEAARHFGFADHDAVRLDALAKGDEVRGGEEPGGVAAGAGDGIDHGADGTFAVCARDVDDALFWRRYLERVEETADIIEAELDPKKLGPEKPGERLAVDHWVAEK